MLTINQAHEYSTFNCGQSDINALMLSSPVLGKGIDNENIYVIEVLNRDFSLQMF